MKPSVVGGVAGLTPGGEGCKGGRTRVVGWRACQPRRGEAGRDFLLVKSRGVLALTVAQSE